MPLITSLRPKPKPRQAWPLRTATPTPWRLCRVGGRAQSLLPRTLNWGEGEELPILLSLVIILLHGREALGSTEAAFAFALAEGGGPGLGGWSASRAAPWRFGAGIRTEDGGRRAEEEARSEGSRKTESGDRKRPSSWYHFGIISHQGREAGGSTEDMFALAFAEGGRTGFGVCARSRAAPWRFGARPGGRFGFEFGRWLATSTERVHSRSPCGIRVRDECTKRSGRSGWTVEHFVLLGCLTTRSIIEVHSC